MKIIFKLWIYTILAISFVFVEETIVAMTPFFN